MPHLRLIHWNEKETTERARLLQDAGHEVIYQSITSAELRSLRETPPDAVIIDLSRLPSQGRDLGVNLRTYKSTRNVPLIFVGGRDDKVEGVKKLLPDATYTTWDHVNVDLDEAIANPPINPVVPDSLMAGYSGTLLVKKLGIKAKSAVALVGAPIGFESTLSELPKGTVLHRRIIENSEITLWFIRSKSELQDGIGKMSEYAREGGLWIIWPKKASGVSSDLTQKLVRQTGLANGLVDFKICSINHIWSGLRFTQRIQR